MKKYKVTISNSRGEVIDNIGTYSSLEEAINRGWAKAQSNYIDSSVDKESKVKEALRTRMYCILRFGGACIDIDEV